MIDLSRFQDDIGQLTRLKTYTHVLLCFPLDDDTSNTKESIISGLETAAQKLISTFPWLAAKVIHDDEHGLFKLAPCPEFAPPNPTVRVKDCTDLCPSWEEIGLARGPFHMFDGKILGPVVAFPEIYQESDDSTPARVIAIQANFIHGGLLLDVAAQHNFIDGGGLFQCVRLLAKIMRGADLSVVEIEQGNRDRRTVIPLLGPDEPLLDHSHLKRPPLSSSSSSSSSHVPLPLPAAAATVTETRPPASWNCFRVPAAQLAQLRETANRDLTQEGSDTAFVSTNDALSAFLWKRLAAIRLHRRQQPDEFSKFSRALDARRAMHVPQEYMGQMGYNATCRLRFGELEKRSLGGVAAVLRRTVQEVNTEYSVRSWATFIAREPDKSTIMFGGTFNPDTDIGVSSLAQVELYSAEFGILGHPELVRRPNFLPLEGCVYFWSRTLAGDFDVLVCLNEVDLQGLRADEEWKMHTEFIG